MAPDVLVGLLAEPDRMRVFAAVVLGATSPAQACHHTGLSARQVATALRRLTDGGVVIETGDGGLAARVEVFAEAMKERGRPAEPNDLDLYDGVPAAGAAVLRAFVVDGRLVAIPAARGKRRVVLEHLVLAFEPGIRYPEREVDAVLRAWHPDHAALRRYLIDEELMARDRAIYWRIGGPVTQ